MTYFINLLNKLKRKKQPSLQEIQLEIDTLIPTNIQEKDKEVLPTILIIDLTNDEK